MSRALQLWRHAPLLYRLHTAWRGWQVERRIALEQQFYEAIIPEVRDTRPIADRLRERLARRGLRMRPKQAGNLHVLYATRPSSWEPHNIPSELARIASLTCYYYAKRGFDDTSPDWPHKRDRMDADLLEFVRATHEQRPIDVFVGYLSGWQVAPATIRAIGELGIVTSAFHWDDKLTFRGKLVGGRLVGPAAVASAYDVNLTNAPSSVVKYEAEGGLALFWPEAANPEHFRPLDRPFEYNVSFIGACYGYRPVLVDFLRRNGVEVAAFGPGWPSGSIPENAMVEVYGKSRINLGSGGIGYSTRAMCLKGRDFEVPMCGALYLTSDNPELGLVYNVGREIAVYRDPAHCLEQIRYYLAHPEAAAAMRVEARRRGLKNHGWAQRFRQLFQIMGFG